MVAGCAREEAPPTTGGAQPPASGGAAGNQATQAPTTPTEPITPQEATGEVSQGVTDTEILIGTTFVASGPLSFIGLPIIDIITAEFARVNAHGGIAGRELRLVHYDDGNDPVQGRIFIERLLEEDRVFGLIAISGGNAPGSLGYMRDFGAPVIGVTNGIAFMYHESDPGSNIFLVEPSNALDGRAMFARAISEELFGPNGNERLPDDALIGMVYSNNDAGHDRFAAVSAMAAEMGMSDRFIGEVVAPDIYPTVIQQMMAAGVQLVLAATLDTAGFTAAMDDAGWVVPVIGGYGTSTIQSHSPEVFNPDRRILATTWADFDAPHAQPMLAALNNALTYHPTLDDATRLSYAENNFARAGYAYARALVIGLERVVEAGLDLTWENFIWAMESEPFDLGGFGPFTFANGQRMGVTELGLFEYVAERNPDGSWNEQALTTRTFESVEDVLAKRN